MDLVECKKCGKLMTSSAGLCPKCGQLNVGRDGFYFVKIEGKDCGPYTIKQMRSMWLSGVITGNMTYTQEGECNWKPLSEMIDFLEPETPPPVKPSPPQFQMNGCSLVVFIALGIVFAVFLLSIL